ncbi:small kinetochore-associated protein isoform X2 [Hoplias malabaricus]|uniref:small kinetochore-associated protein isoform X2 n=1 Tax=Hoplias malabaricus TaxID=27720 RepID=UPI0034631B3F
MLDPSKIFETNMKRVEKGQIHDSAIPTYANPSSRKANVKNDTETTTRKTQPKALKGPSIKYGQTNDLREQNRLLVAANEDLQKQILEIKKYVTVLEQRCNDFQENNSEIRKKLQDCHAVIIAEHIDPVSGEKKTIEQTEDQRKELMMVSQNLLTELKQFDDVAKEHGTHLAEMNSAMKSLQEAREKLLLNRETFCVDAEEMENALEEAERLLIE